jgi:hypothetical protein
MISDRRLANLQPVQKGQSGNPSGRRKIPKDVKELTRGLTKEACHTRPYSSDANGNMHDRGDDGGGGMYGRSNRIGRTLHRPLPIPHGSHRRMLCIVRYIINDDVTSSELPKAGNGQTPRV